MTTTLQTLEALEAELIQETYLFLQTIRDDAKTHNPEDIADDDGRPCIDVRLQVLPSGDYSHRFGLGCYDDDHRGYWGSASVGPDDDETTLIEMARDMVAQVLDEASTD